MNSKKSITMKDIAERTGFSVNTVARALKDRDDVAPESKKRIQQVAAELNYVSNGAASYLRTGHSRTIAVILADITNPTFSEGVREIEQYAVRDRYALMIFNTNEDCSAERLAIQTAISKNVDGILICPCAESRENLEYLYQTGTPFVLLGRKADPKYPWVVKDDLACGRLAARRLIRDANCKRILVINGPQGISSAYERAIGFAEELSAAGLCQDPALSVETDVRFGALRKILQKLDSDGIRYDGIFAFSDILAMEAMNILLGKGVRIPQDIAIAGVDNLCKTFPYLTPVDSVGEVGESLYCVSYRKLINILNRSDTSPLHITLDVQLSSHGSVLPKA